MTLDLDLKRREADLTVRELSRRAGTDYAKTWRYVRAQSQLTANELRSIEHVVWEALREQQRA